MGILIRKNSEAEYFSWGKKIQMCSTYRSIFTRENVAGERTTTIITLPEHIHNHSSKTIAYIP